MKIAKIIIHVYMETEQGVFEKEFESIGDAAKYVQEITEKLYGIEKKV